VNRWLVSFSFCIIALPMNSNASMQGCGAPTITSLAPSGATIYPPYYCSYQSPCTCSTQNNGNLKVCTLTDMQLQSFQNQPGCPVDNYGHDAMQIYGQWPNCVEGIYTAVLPLWWFPPGGPDYRHIWQDNAVSACGMIYGGAAITLGGSSVPPQFGAASNPIQSAEYDGASHNYYLSNVLNFNLIGPVEMVVQNDVWDYCDGCSLTVRRKTTYKVTNSDGSVAPNIPLGEVNDYGSSNCNEGRPSMFMNSCTIAKGQPIGNPSGPPVNQSNGMYATDANGQFTDGWSMGGDNYTPAGCGYNVNYDHWQLCGIGLDSQNHEINAGLTFGTVSGYIQNRETGIRNTSGSNPKIYVLPTDPITCPQDQSGCPNAIPDGTVIKP
jgi:hypothetical protein